MWVWVNSGRWWWTGRPGMLWFMGLRRVRHDWATEPNWRVTLTLSLYLHKFKIHPLQSKSRSAIHLSPECFHKSVISPEVDLLFWSPYLSTFSINTVTWIVPGPTSTCGIDLFLWDYTPFPPSVDPTRLWRDYLQVKLLSRVRLFVTPWTVAHQAPLSMRFSRPRILKRVAISFSRGSSQPRDQTWVSSTAGRFFTNKPPGSHGLHLNLSKSLFHT